MSEVSYIGGHRETWKNTCEKSAGVEEMASQHEHISAMTRKVLQHVTVPCINTVEEQHVEDTTAQLS